MKNERAGKPPSRFFLKNCSCSTLALTDLSWIFTSPQNLGSMITISDDEDELAVIEHELIPCEECGQRFDPAALVAHVLQSHRCHRSRDEGASSPVLIPCEICSDLFLPTEYLKHLQEHEAKEKTFDLSNHHTPVSMAARWVERIRREADEANLQCIANFDLAVSFAQRAVREASFLEAKLAGPKVVYHWTPSKNFQSIINSNLQVPDQKYVFNQTDVGIYGAGIYTSPYFEYGRAYAHGNGGCFICLGLPGRQYSASSQWCFGQPCQEGFETHVSADRGRKEWIFFSSDQLLPFFWVNETTQPSALPLVRGVEAMIREDLKDAVQDAGPNPSASKKTVRKSIHKRPTATRTGRRPCGI